MSLKHYSIKASKSDNGRQVTIEITYMPSQKPRITLRIDETDIDNLEEWAKEEFLTVPQLARVIVKRAIAEWLSDKNQQKNLSLKSKEES